MPIFVQDDWRIHPQLTLTAGLRHELQNNIRDHRDLAPRLAFAWAPGGSAGRFLLRAAKPSSRNTLIWAAAAIDHITPALKELATNTESTLVPAKCSGNRLPDLEHRARGWNAREEPHKHWHPFATGPSDLGLPGDSSRTQSWSWCRRSGFHGSDWLHPLVPNVSRCCRTSGRRFQPSHRVPRICRISVR